ncbi:MAG: hypothetical protein A2882_13870 [Phenylobacterium sp. RIFCSPHIGHO2_01_FULL_70_10]|nr:MAG: hypothetical protein A2882_13870 [Phenylobacterium sp. RIFCSPHIGHO2_01_FULL_70_10]
MTISSPTAVGAACPSAWAKAGLAASAAARARSEIPPMRDVVPDMVMIPTLPELVALGPLHTPRS